MGDRGGDRKFAIYIFNASWFVKLVAHLAALCNKYTPLIICSFSVAQRIEFFGIWKGNS